MKRVNLLYFSPTETTKKTLREVAKAINLKAIEHDLLLPRSREDSINLSEDDLLLIGAPVYAGRIPRLFNEFLSNKLSGGKYAIIIAVYGNRVYDNALAEMKSLLNEKNIRVIGAAAFIGEHSYSKRIASDRPDDLDGAKQYAFGLLINDKLEKENFSEVDVPGEAPEGKARVSPYFTNTNQNCVLCEVCARECPVGAIPLESPQSDANESCIMCCRCIKNCSYQAREHNFEDLDRLIEKLENKLENIRMEVEIFL